MSRMPTAEYKANGLPFLADASTTLSPLRDFLLAWSPFSLSCRDIIKNEADDEVYKQQLDFTQLIAASLIGCEILPSMQR